MPHSSSERFIIKPIHLLLMVAVSLFVAPRSAFVSADSSPSRINEPHIKNPSFGACASSVSSPYNWNASTEVNYSAEEREFVGKYVDIRKTLDYSYHANYSVARQKVQDAIIDSMLNATWLIGHDGEVCSVPDRPWIVFTAGAMGSGKSWTVRHLAETGRLPLDSFVTVDPDDIRRALPGEFLPGLFLNHV